MPVVLALVIDTSSAAVTSAIVEIPPTGEPVVRAARTTIDARAHAELLTPSIAAGLDEAGLGPGDLDAVIAGLGPGPFTGLRVGLVTALAIADARSLPAYGVCSLDAIAAELGHPGPLLVAGDARRREVYWARYSAGFPSSGVRLSGPAVDLPAALDQDGSDPGTEAMAGAGARMYADVLGRRLLGRRLLGRRLLDTDYPTPLGLARLAATRVRTGAAGEPLTPLYLRRPDAVAAASFKAVTP